MKFYTYLFFGLLLTGCGTASEDNTPEQSNNTETPTDLDGVSETETPTDSDDDVDAEIPTDSDDDSDTVVLPVIPSDCEVSVIASSEDGDNVADNVLGNDTATRWSAEGNGQTLRLDLCEYTTINAVDVALFKGNERNSTFSIEVSNDDTSWTTALAKTTSSGDSTEAETYAMDTITARYVRYTGYGNTDSTGLWNSVTIFSVVECTGGNCEAVALPVEDPVTSPTIPTSDCESVGKMSYNGECVEWLEVYEAEHGDIGENDHLISFSPIEMTFDALAAKHVTTNGNGWRHELKIKSSGGYRVAMTDVYELFKAKIHVVLSDGAKTIVAQHHASDTGTITKLYVADLDESGFDAAPDGSESDSTEMNGVFDVYIRLAKEDGSGETKHLLTTIKSGESFDFEEENDHGVITVKINGQALAPLTIEDSTESYFKFGNYQQAQNPETGSKLASGNADGDYEAFYAEYFSESKITFTEMSYIRNVD